MITLAPWQTLINHDSSLQSLNKLFNFLELLGGYQPVLTDVIFLTDFELGNQSLGFSLNDNVVNGAIESITLTIDTSFSKLKKSYTCTIVDPSETRSKAIQLIVNIFKDLRAEYGVYKLPHSECELDCNFKLASFTRYLAQYVKGVSFPYTKTEFSSDIPSLEDMAEILINSENLPDVLKVLRPAKLPLTDSLIHTVVSKIFMAYLDEIIAAKEHADDPLTINQLQELLSLARDLYIKSGDNMVCDYMVIMITNDGFKEAAIFKSISPVEIDKEALNRLLTLPADVNGNEEFDAFVISLSKQQKQSDNKVRLVQ